MWMDILIFADKSQSVGPGGLGSIGSQVATSLFGLNIAQAGPALYSRVGLGVYASNVTVLGDLTKYTDQTTFETDALTLETYHDASDTIVDIYQALVSAQNIFETQSTSNPNRQVRKVIVLFASSYNQIGQNDPVTIANQMKNQGIVIITVDYNDAQGTATSTLSQISTPFMNFSSGDANSLDTTFVQINQALCDANCMCPPSMIQNTGVNATTNLPIYYSDCFIGFKSGSFAQFAEPTCETAGIANGATGFIYGALVAYTSQAKQNFVIQNVLPTIDSPPRFHTGLHRDTDNSWIWYGYNKTAFPEGTYQPWAPGFSNNSSGNCALLDNVGGTFMWETENCLGQNPIPYICQVRACDSTYGSCDCTNFFNDKSTCGQQ